VRDDYKPSGGECGRTFWEKAREATEAGGTLSLPTRERSAMAKMDRPDLGKAAWGEDVHRRLAMCLVGEPRERSGADPRFGDGSDPSHVWLQMLGWSGSDLFFLFGWRNEIGNE
jgi:hypothetical protein